MKDSPLVSIVIPNYNYGQFLPAAIESALGQTYPEVEVIVVDDGSTDDSRKVISSFEPKVASLFKENGGQDSAINAGFGLTRGDIIVFVDADDALLPTAVQEAVERFDRNGGVVSRVSWPILEVDEQGQETGKVIPDEPLPEGDLLSEVARWGPSSPATAPNTTASAFARPFLESVMPLPELGVKSGSADACLTMLAPLYGEIRAIQSPQGVYRHHESNSYWGRTIERLEPTLWAYERQCEMLVSELRERGVVADPEAWKKTAWLPRLSASVEDIVRNVPSGERFILIDDDQWAAGEDIEGRPRIPFPERRGVYWGVPGDDENAIQEVERLRRSGIMYVVVAWPAFWWLEHFRRFAQHLTKSATKLVENDRVIVLRLEPGVTDPE